MLICLRIAFFLTSALLIGCTPQYQVKDTSQGVAQISFTNGAIAASPAIVVHLYAPRELSCSDNLSGVQELGRINAGNILMLKDSPGPVSIEAGAPFRVLSFVSLGMTRGGCSVQSVFIPEKNQEYNLNFNFPYPYVCEVSISRENGANISTPVEIIETRACN